ncbi:MAG TPA: class F sortase [Thermomicrobiales bacterium]|nr:class F sortase [Thermomicrobiales bacterium]
MTNEYETNSRFVTNRRNLLGAGVVGLAAVLGLSATAAAQDQIVSTKQGEIPTTGGQRPGPIGPEPEVPEIQGVLPVSIAIAKINLNAQVETIQIVDGQMQDPTGPWVVSWYKETGKLGEIDNIVMAGHLDYWDVGPAVFYNIAQLAPKDPIDVTGDDGETYSYEVEYVKQYDAANAPIQEIIGPTDTEDLTLITCGGPFDYQNGVYLQRTVVRSHRIKS